MFCAKSHKIKNPFLFLHSRMKAEELAVVVGTNIDQFKGNITQLL